MNNSPMISVLLPVYNCGSYIFEAVQSILNQTYHNFELLIIDDCSTDDTLQIVRSFDDARIQLITKEKNSGYTNSLNLALGLAKGKYIARMDGDDIARHDRFEKQLSFLENNIDYIVCGSNYKIIGSNQEIQLPEHYEQIKMELLETCCIAHPSVMFRKSVLIDNGLQYDHQREPAEDYALWIRLVFLGKFYNFQEALLNYRVHDQQISQVKYKKQLESASQSKYELLTQHTHSLTTEQSLFLKKSFSKENKIDFHEFEIFNSVREALTALNSNAFFDPNGYKVFMAKWEKKVLLGYFNTKNRYSPLFFFRYLIVRFSYHLKLTNKELLLLFVKSFTFYKIGGKN